MVMMNPIRRVLAVSVLVAAAACSGDTTAPVANHISGTWLLHEHLVAAAAGVTCDDTARLSLQQDNTRLALAGTQTGMCRSGAGDSVPNNGAVSGAGRLGAAGAVTFAYAGCNYVGTIETGDGVLNGTAQCSAAGVTASGTWRMGRADFVAPTAATLMTSGAVSHGDTIVVQVTAADSEALAFVGDSVAFDPVNYSSDCPLHLPTVAESLAVSGKGAQQTFRAAVPACAWYARVYGFAVDTAGNRSGDALNPLPIVLPESQVSGTIDDTVYTLGDTVRITVTATNPRGLGWVGYRWGDPNPVGADSIAASGTSTSKSFTLVVPHTGAIPQVLVTPFARHRLGWLSTTAYLVARVTDAVRLPIERLTLPGMPTDIAYAAGSDRVFLNDTGRSVVHTVTLAPFALDSTYAVGARAVSLDLSGSEDSLVVALQGQLALALVRRGSGTVQTVALSPPDLTDIYDARHVRVVGNGRALVLIGSGSAGHVVQLDLGTGAQRDRVPWSGYGTLDRSSDRTRLLLIDGGSPVGDQQYVAASDTFLPPQSGAVSLFGTEAQVSANDPMSQWLVGCQLFTADMSSIRVFSDPSVGFGPSALARDDTRAYCPRLDGVVEFDVATGNRLRAIWLPLRPDVLKALPGNRLLAASGNQLYLVTLP